jgi:hypothetical protein
LSTGHFYLAQIGHYHFAPTPLHFETAQRSRYLIKTENRGSSDKARPLTLWL